MNKNDPVNSERRRHTQNYPHPAVYKSDRYDMICEKNHFIVQVGLKKTVFIKWHNDSAVIN